MTRSIRYPADEQFKPFAGVDRELAHPVRHVARTRAVCLHHQLLRRSQSVSIQTPPDWPAVPVEPCCQTHWGALPGGIDWTNASPVMICTANADYASAFPNCGGPNNLSQAFPLDYWQPKIGIGRRMAQPEGLSSTRCKAFLSPTDPDGTCAQYSNQPGKVTNWWVYELKEPKRGSYVFTANVSFQKGEKGYYAVLNGCKLEPPPPTGAQ